MVKHNRQRHCFVPGCRSGYVSALAKGQKTSLFAVPTDEKRFKDWERALSCFDKTLEKRCVLCELHFDNRYICRTYRHTINGELVEIPRTRPILSPDAVPTLFFHRPKRSPRVSRTRAAAPSRPARRGRPRNVGAAARSPAHEVPLPAQPQSELDISDTSATTAEETVDEADMAELDDVYPEDEDELDDASSPDLCPDIDLGELSSLPSTPAPDGKRTVTPHIVTARKATPPPQQPDPPQPAPQQPAPQKPSCVAAQSVRTIAAMLTAASSASSATSSATSPLCTAPVAALEAPAFLATFDSSWLPNRYWAMHYVKHTTKCVVFSYCTLLANKPTFTKIVVCEENKEAIQCEASIEGSHVKTVVVTTAEEVKKFLEDVDAIKFCEGAGASEEFSITSLHNCKVHGGRLHSLKCNQLCSAGSRACDHCKYLRKLLQNKVSYYKRKLGPPSATAGPTTAAEMPQGSGDGETASTVQVPPQQGKTQWTDGRQLLVKTCIEASKRDQAPGDKTAQDEEWTLECTFYPVT